MESDTIPLRLHIDTILLKFASKSIFSKLPAENDWACFAEHKRQHPLPSLVKLV